MKTPICDFLQEYLASDPLRLHMPGHKGVGELGVEGLDITEICGADDLYAPTGIIGESEENAAQLFGSARTLYSTEGSSQCIRAMLYLARLHALRIGRSPRILAARNVHKTFLSAVGLLDMEVEWIPSRPNDTYLSFSPDWDALEELLAKEPPVAVYVTSPDYLGNCLPLERLSCLCHRHGALLLVDNAHGAYLKFLEEPRHPLDLGADLCCDSAHKTLPALTGAAYLHLALTAPEGMAEEAKDAMALFGSTSPSYLILRSLDRLNPYLAKEFPATLARFLPLLEDYKRRWVRLGYRFVGNEPLKLTLDAKSFGYLGTDLARLLREQNIECEFADPDFLVLMPSCKLGAEGLERLSHTLTEIPKKESITERPPAPLSLPRVLSIREAMLSPWRWVSLEEAHGRVLATLSLSCPPAVPIAVCGERLNEDALKSFRYYGIEGCRVVCQ